MAEPRKLLARRAIAKLRFVAQREQRFLAARRRPARAIASTSSSDKICWLAAAAAMSKRAVMTNVPAQLGERNEHLAGIRNDRAMRAVAAVRLAASSNGSSSLRLTSARASWRVKFRSSGKSQSGDALFCGAPATRVKCEIGVGAGLGLEREEGIDIFRTIDIEAEIAGRQHERGMPCARPASQCWSKLRGPKHSGRRVRRTACEQIGAAVVVA